MDKKYAILFIALIFFLGISHVGLCQTVNSKITPTCCASKSSPSRDAEDCLSHCLKQKVVTVKIESLIQEDLKTKIPIFLGKTHHNPQSYLFNSILFRDLNQINAKLNISHIYFVAIFNHAPPFLSR